MKVEYSADHSKFIEEDVSSVQLHYYHIKIYNEGKKLYKIMINGHKLDLHFKKELKEREFKPDDHYTVIHLQDTKVIGYYK